MKAAGADPPPLRNRPTLSDAAKQLCDIYRLLDRSRQIGMTEYFIPLSEVVAYCDLVRLDDVEERLRLARLIQRIDSEMLIFRDEKRKKASDSKTKAKKP